MAGCRGDDRAGSGGVREWERRRGRPPSHGLTVPAPPCSRWLAAAALITAESGRWRIRQTLGSHLATGETGRGFHGCPRSVSVASVVPGKCSLRGACFLGRPLVARRRLPIVDVQATVAGLLDVLESLAQFDDVQITATAFDDRVS